MPIGKDSITKRVIGTTETPAQRPIKPAVKTAPKVEPKLKEGVLPTPTAPKGLENVEASQSETEPKAEPKAEPKPKAPAKSKSAPKAVKPALPAEPVKTEPATAVMGNISPEVVEKVTGHPENTASKPVQITDDMPNYLL